MRFKKPLALIICFSAFFGGISFAIESCQSVSLSGRAVYIASSTPCQLQFDRPFMVTPQYAGPSVGTGKLPSYTINTPHCNPSQARFYYKGWNRVIKPAKCPAGTTLIVTGGNNLGLTPPAVFTITEAK